MERFVARMVGTAGLRAAIFEEIEADTTATGAAIVVVIVSSIAAAIGAGAIDGRSMIGILAGSILSWMAWILLTLFIGTQLLAERGTQVDFGQVLRTTGFSASVGLLRIFGVIPVVGHAIFGIVTIWMLMTFVVAIRQAFDYTSTGRALAVCLLGWMIHVVLFFGFVRILV